MQRLVHLLPRSRAVMSQSGALMSQSGAVMSGCGAVLLQGRLLSNCSTAAVTPSSFNPEAYMRFPQFLHDINSKLTHHKNTQETGNVLTKGRLVYTKKCVTVEKETMSVLEKLSDADKIDLKQLSVGCKGLFWRSGIDYTCVPCVFSMQGHFSADKFLDELGINSPSFGLSIKFTYFHRGMLPELPIISYQGEDDMNVYRAPKDTIFSILDKYNEVYHITVGEGVINPVLQFIVGKADDKLIGFVSAAVVE